MIANVEFLNSHDAEDGAVIRNIEACQAISQTVQTSLGPYGRNKIVINHLQKMILTSDAASILRELDVVHPAAKLLVMGSQQQDMEMGDGTNMVIILGGELLKKAEELLRVGLKTSDIVQGFEKAQNFALKVLEGGDYSFLEDFLVSTRLQLLTNFKLYRSRGRPSSGTSLSNRTQQGPSYGCCQQTGRNRRFFVLVGCRGRPLRLAQEPPELQRG